MRQISSRQREERDNDRLDDAADASYPLAPRADVRTPRSPQSTTAPKDFTAQVMARLSTLPAPVDPSRERALRARAKATTIARVYFTLILAAAVGVAMLALVAPWALVTMIVSLISGVLLVVTGAAFIARATGGFISGFGVIYAAMIAALTPSLLMLWRRFRRHRSRANQ